jgi:DNA-binding MarR family transcriptional regulator
VSLNISPTHDDPDPAPTPGDRAAAPSDTPPTTTSAPDREAVIAELVGEMTSWSPKDRMHVFRSWLKGSLSLIHLHVLTVLEMGGPLPMSRLADTLDVSVASATGIVTRMEERSLVERRHDREDRRVVLVIPTETGLAVFRDMMEQRREHLAEVLGRLSDEELEGFLRGLRAVRAARNEMHSEAAVQASVAGTPPLPADPATQETAR